VRVLDLHHLQRNLAGKEARARNGNNVIRIMIRVLGRFGDEHSHVTVRKISAEGDVPEVIDLRQVHEY
jgi:hypothetical protein